MKGRGPDFSKEFDDKLRRQVKFLDYAPILHISALTGERAPKVLETIDKVADARLQARADRRAEPVRSGRDRRASARPAPAAGGADPVRRADQRRAADVRVLHQRRDRVPLLLRAVPGQPAARVVRLDGTPIRIQVDEEQKSSCSRGQLETSGQPACSRERRLHWQLS